MTKCGLPAERKRLEPDLPIIDAHHHLWQVPGFEYQLDDLLADLSDGHNIRQTVFVECGHAYRTTGPEALRPLGRPMKCVVAIAKRAASRGIPNICSAIVGHADLRLGEHVETVLQAHIEASGGRFRGIRQILARSDVQKRHLLPPPPKNLASDPAFRHGFALLSRLGLSFDAWLFHPQLPELTWRPRVSGHSHRLHPFGRAARDRPLQEQTRRSFGNGALPSRSSRAAPTCI